MSAADPVLCPTCGQHVGTERARVLGFEQVGELPADLDLSAHEFAPTAPMPTAEQLERQGALIAEGYALHLGQFAVAAVSAPPPACIDGQHEGATEYAGADTLPGYRWLDDRAAQLATGRPPRQAPRDALDQAALDDEETYSPERGAAIAIQLTVLITCIALLALVWVHRPG